MRTLGKEIRKARIDREWEQKDLCARVHISQKHLSAIEREKTDPGFQLVLRLASALNLDLNSLVPRAEEEEIPHVG